MAKFKWFAVVAVLLAAGYYFLSGDSKEAQKDPRNTVNNVNSVTAAKGSIDIVVEALGTVTPRSVVTVQSRVDGQLVNLHFKEGQMVVAGDLLAELDDRQFAAQLKQAEGQKLRDEAQLAEARQTLQRYTALVAKDSIPRQQLDTQASLVKQYEGAVKNDEGLVDAAKTQLDYTRITAPISGRIGLRKADLGNIVKASSTDGIAVITEIDPISVLFSIPEDRIPEVMSYMKDGTALRVEAWNREKTAKLVDGKLEAVDNQVDVTTGTLKMRAEFANKDSSLYPNQFVNIKLTLGQKQDVLVLPSSALQRGSMGTFVYRIKDDSTVEAVPIKTGITQADIMSVTSGIELGDKIVSEGAGSLRNGTKVVISDGKDKKDKEGKKHAHEDKPATTP